jgi:hypothetical protein
MAGKMSSRTTQTDQTSQVTVAAVYQGAPVDNINSKFNMFNVLYTNADCFTNKRDDLVLF